MLNVVIPMAGRGQRFVDAGYELPKPLIPVHGMPMARVVVNNVRPQCPHRFIFICLAEHLDNFPLAAELRSWAPGCAIVPVSRVTEGAACTILLARDLIENNRPLMIANCDQWVDIEIDDYIRDVEQRSLDGLIMTMSANHPKWSYVRLSREKMVSEVVEKVVVSNDATVGIYNFRYGSDFTRAADRMIAADFRVNGEFYVAPVYNTMISDGMRIGIYNAGSELNGMYGLGRPDDLEKFLSLPVSRKATFLGR